MAKITGEWSGNALATTTTINCLPNTAEEMLLQGFYKIRHNGGTFVTGLFFNPFTLETGTKVLRDYDYSDGSRDNDSLYYMPINYEVEKIFAHLLGWLFKGDLVEVFKGRKVPKGTTGTITGFRYWKDCYGRIQTTYALIHTSTGEDVKTSITNCRLLNTP